MLDKLSLPWTGGKAKEPDSKAAADFIRQANKARDRKAWFEAASLYRRALALTPDNAGIHVQCGHMLKEAGILPDAETHYLRALALTPDDPDLALQMGHFYKIAGRLREAEGSYKRALELSPGWPDPTAELSMLHAKGFRGQPRASGDARSEPAGSLMLPRGGEAPEFEAHVAEFGLLDSIEALAPELAPRNPLDQFRGHHESIHIHRFGRSERTRWGTRNTLRGVEALRGYCTSHTPIVEVLLIVDGLVFHREGPLQGVPLRAEGETTRLLKYTFNIWYDFAQFVDGRYHIELCFVDARQHRRVHNEYVVIAPALRADRYPDSDSVVAVSYADPRSIEEQINAQPSMVRPAQRQLFAKPPRAVLVVRIDQLGDMVTSVPALRRLREILPGSRLVGLIAPGNAELVSSLKLFDEVILADIPDDPLERRRTMSVSQQHDLRRTLKSYGFDMAIDMSASDVSRPLLVLSGAPLIYGIGYRRFLPLNFEMETVTRDFANDSEIVPHSTKMMGFVEWLNIFMKSHATIVPRTDLARSSLTKFGISESERFVVLHTGARIVFSRWPHYDKLSSLILDKTKLKVVMLSDDPAMRKRLPPELTNDERFQLIDRRLAFDDFDSLVSFCSAFVGNDSGPKHLASLRGANVVSIHCARNNWNEWGQENKGYIISRRVPCAGCQIHHDPEDCGKEFVCVRNISPQEVYQSMSAFLA